MKNILFLTHTVNRFCAGKLQGVETAAKVRGWTVNTVEFGWTEWSIVDIIRTMNPDGIILEGGRLAKSIDTRPFRARPSVFLDTNLDTPKGAAIVRSDAEAIADLAADELLSASPVAAASFSLAPHTVWSLRREKRFCERMRRAKVPCRMLRKADAISNLRRPFALFAVNDASAATVLRCSERLGLSCPQDFTLVSVDNDEHFCEHAVPKVSSVAQDFLRAGTAAVETLERIFARRKIGSTLKIPPIGLVRRQSSVRPHLHVSIARKAAEMVDLYSTDGLTVGRLAETLGSSRRTVELHFRETFGKTIGEAILARRFAEVERLLADPFRSLDVIAGRCGWKSPTHLKRLFHKRYGMTMSAWRRQHQ